MPCAVPFIICANTSSKPAFWSASAASGSDCTGTTSSASPCTKRIGGRTTTSSTKSSGASKRPENPTTPATSSSRRGATCSAIIVPWEKPNSTTCSGNTSSSTIKASRKAFKSATAEVMPRSASSSEEPSIHGMGNHWNPMGAPAQPSGASGATNKVSGKCSPKGSARPKRSAPFAPYPCKNTTTERVSPETASLR